MKYNIHLFRLSIFSLFIFGPFSLFCQLSNHQIEKMITAEFDSIRSGSIKNHDYRFDSSNERHFLDFVKKYEHDQSVQVRSRVQEFKAGIAMLSNDTLIRQQVVEDFFCNFTDPNSGISQYAMYILTSFKQNDFSKTAKKIMVSIFNQPNYNSDFLLLCATAQLKELIPQLTKLAVFFDRTKEAWYSTTEWYACLAVARMGNAVKIDNMIAAVELELAPDLRVLRLLKQMAYTRQPDCLKLLQKYLESTERLPGVKETGNGTEFRQYAMEYLAQYIEGFPFNVKPYYSKEEIETARTFLRNHKSK